MKNWLCVAALALLPSALPAAELPASGSVEVLFSPWDDAEGAIIREIGAARQSVRMQAFLLTSRSIARALAGTQARGVQVEVLADSEMVAKGENSQVPRLHETGIDVRLETRYAAAHNKILLIDAEGEHPVVITGSYNFTWSAQARNAENLLILRGNRPLAQAYLANWRRHRSDALPFLDVVKP